MFKEVNLLDIKSKLKEQYVSIDSFLWTIQGLIDAKKYDEAKAELERLRHEVWYNASEASDENGFHFNKALLACRKPSKTDPTKTYVDFYLQIKKDSSPIAIKISFYNPSIFRFMLANSDKVEAYVSKSVSVKPVKEE